jgi:polyhydroxyalkanoate synthesis regulator phasin
LGIKYTELIPVLTKAIQEQQAEIDALKAQVAALQARR